jgi:hypothetical protein
LALDPYQWSGVVGNTKLLVALAAVSGAFACSLVVVIVLILRSRRQSARAADTAPPTLLYV